MMQEETEESEAPPPKRTRAASGIRDRGTILPEICVICEKKDRWLKRRSKSVRDKLCKAETTDAGCEECEGRMCGCQRAGLKCTDLCQCAKKTPCKIKRQRPDSREGEDESSDDSDDSDIEADV